jgi:site-specific DNA-methyltransferase (adenine-specific)
VSGSKKALHLNQKPLELIDLTIEATTDPGDVVWEPFGGLCTAAVSAKRLGRKALATEVNEEVYQEAVKRLRSTTSEAEIGEGGGIKTDKESYNANSNLSLF